MSARRPTSHSSREKRKSPRVQKDKTTRSSEVDLSASVPVPEESFQDIDFIDFFGDGSEPLTVELYRDRPKYVGEIAINGFCETLPPGADLQYIKDGYGGGRFRVLQRNATGKVTKQRYCDIAGNALVPEEKKTAGLEPVAADGDGSEADSPAEALVHVDGVPVSGVLAKDIEIIKSVMLLKAVLREPNPNDRILDMVLEQRKPPDLLGSLKDIAPLIATIKELMGEFSQQGSASGSNFIDLAREGLKAFGEYAKVTRRPGPVRLPVSPVSPAAPAPAAISETPTDPAQQIDTTLQPVVETNLEESESPMPLTPLAIMDSAVQTIVQSFNLGTHTESVVLFLINRVPFSAEQRREYLTDARKDELFIAAELIMDDAVEGYADDAEKRARFKVYFERILNGFLSAE